VILFLLTLGTASCGFTPVYGPGSKTGAAISDIVVAPPDNNRASYILVSELESRIGRNLNGQKLLEHRILVFEEGLGLESSAPRTRIVGKVTFEVKSIEDERVLFGGLVENFVSFATTSIITASTRDDAMERLMFSMRRPRPIEISLAGEFPGAFG
jgi:LPS-assembly lipoprotein